MIWNCIDNLEDKMIYSEHSLVCMWGWLSWVTHLPNINTEPLASVMGVITAATIRAWAECEQRVCVTNYGDQSVTHNKHGGALNVSCHWNNISNKRNGLVKEVNITNVSTFIWWTDYQVKVKQFSQGLTQFRTGLRKLDPINPTTLVFDFEFVNQ